jgi:lipoate-protein ligase A
MAADVWMIDRQILSVRDLHGLGIPADPPRTIRWCEPTDAALVLGSAQKAADVDVARLHAADLDLVRRKSGGGAVLVEPGDMLWVDVIVPKGDPLWSDDVGRAFSWLGDVWRRTLEVVGCENVTVHEGAMVTTEWSRTICFAGLGPGECLVDGKKVVGISQKRTRAGALFQCSLLLRFDPVRIVSLFDLPASSDADAVDALRRTVGSVDVAAAAIESAFTKSLEKTGFLSPQ